MRHITTPFSDELIRSLKAGEQVLLSGEIFTGRDAAHKRLTEMLIKGEDFPLDIHGQAVYYAGPCPAMPGRVIGSVGPTTSSRMDSYAPRLIEEGLRVMIGKGNRSRAVTDAIIKHCGLYMAAVGGAGALYSRCVEHAEIVAFKDLGPEAVYRLKVRDMPLVVAIDCTGGNIYELRR